MLLPPDLRDWVPEDDIVHFVIEAVERMPWTPDSFAINLRGSGSKQYSPRMMLALLVYCYANGIFSSRRIERATYRDVGVRYLTDDSHPDHDTICEFRRRNQKAFAAAFLHVLKLARELGVLKVSTVSVAGTHLDANASKSKNVRYDRAVELERHSGSISTICFGRRKRPMPTRRPTGNRCPRKFRGASDCWKRGKRRKPT